MTSRDHPLNHGPHNPREPFDATTRTNPADAPPRRPWSHQSLDDYETRRRDER